MKVKFLNSIFSIITLVVSISCSKNNISPDNSIIIKEVAYNLKFGNYTEIGYNSQYKKDNTELTISDQQDISTWGENGFIVVKIDLYSSKGIPTNNKFQIKDQTSISDDFSFVEIDIYGTSSIVTKNLISGSLEIKGKDFSKLEVIIDGVDRNGDKIKGSFKGSFN